MELKIQIQNLKTIITHKIFQKQEQTKGSASLVKLLVFNKFIFLLLFLFFSLHGFSQNPMVKVQVETSSIRIGEQFDFRISVNETENVILPKLELKGLEIIDSAKIDTLRNMLIQKYIITGFDSGAFYIPQQQVFVKNQAYLTDSLLIKVATVAIDTTEYDDLIQASKEALDAALAIAKPGVTFRELGIAQEEAVKKHGLNIITNLSGHSLGLYKIHAGNNVPTYDNNDKTVLEEGMVLAIEPFVTRGTGKITQKGEPTVFMMHNPRNSRSVFARAILPYIKEKKGLAFCEKEIARKFGTKGRAGLRELIKEDIIGTYPPLVQIDGEFVAQFEHTVIVADEPIITTK
jgi:hypothetical protein